MFVVKIIFAVLQVITGLFFVKGFGEEGTSTFGKLLCGLGAVELFAFVWIVASRGFF